MDRANQCHIFETSKIEIRNRHGSGCTLSSAIASYIAQRKGLYDAVDLGQQYVYNDIYTGKDVQTRKGNDLLNHFFNPQKLMKMNWSEQSWKTIENKYASILEMAFIRELANGSLPREKFQFYMAQDSLYLEHFGRALALIGVKAYDLQDALAYIRFAEETIVVENALHESYFEDFGVMNKGILQPTCHHYVHFLKSTAALEPVEVAMAATLPCFWIYKKVGDYILDNQESNNNPYQRWIDTYGGEEFAESVENAIAICSHAAENTTPEIRNKMTEAFITAARMEYHFWEAAYDLNVWK